MNPIHNRQPTVQCLEFHRVEQRSVMNIHSKARTPLGGHAHRWLFITGTAVAGLEVRDTVYQYLLSEY